jgi:DNA-directed RNA polymerase specialized sigma24 family protein
MDLTPESFDRLLAWLHPSDREEAGKIYLTIRSGLVKKFASHGCPIPGRLADITVDRVAKKLPEIIDGWEGDPERYFHRVAYYILLEYWAKQHDEVELPDELPMDEEDEDETLEPNLDCLEECMKSIPTGKQELIKEYYCGEGPKIPRRKAMAERLGIELPALRVMVLRIKQSLKSCIEKCLELQPS